MSWHHLGDSERIRGRAGELFRLAAEDQEKQSPTSQIILMAEALATPAAEGVPGAAVSSHPVYLLEADLHASCSPEAKGFIFLWVPRRPGLMMEIHVVPMSTSALKINSHFYLTPVSKSLFLSPPKLILDQEKECV